MQDQKAVDSIMHAYDGEVPGASVLVVRDGVQLVHRAYGLANLEDRDRRDTGNQLPTGLGYQTVHRRSHPVASRRRSPRPERSHSAMAAVAPRDRRCDHDSRIC